MPIETPLIKLALIEVPPIEAPPTEAPPTEVPSTERTLLNVELFYTLELQFTKPVISNIEETETYGADNDTADIEKRDDTFIDNLQAILVQKMKLIREGNRHLCKSDMVAFFRREKEQGAKVKIEEKLKYRANNEMIEGKW